MLKLNEVFKEVMNTHKYKDLTKEYLKNHINKLIIDEKIAKNATGCDQFVDLVFILKTPFSVLMISRE